MMDGGKHRIIVEENLLEAKKKKKKRLDTVSGGLPMTREAPAEMIWIIIYEFMRLV